MSSPLPQLPANPLGDLPDNPLGAPPRPPLIGSREPLRLPVGRKLRRGGGRSTKAPLPSLARPQGHQTAQKPQVVQVINRPAPAAPAASQPAPAPTTPRRTASGRATAEARRQAVDDLVGRDIGHFYRGMHHTSRAKYATGLREKAKDLRTRYVRGGNAELDADIAEARDNRKHEREMQAKVKALRARQKAQGGRFDPAAPDRAGQAPPTPPTPGESEE
jgi:hypothetical protein